MSVLYIARYPVVFDSELKSSVEKHNVEIINTQNKVYINGAIADPSVRTIKAPKRARKITIGANHHFLRTFRKSQNSESIESFDIACSQLFEFDGINPSPLSLFPIASATRRYPSAL